MKYKGREMKVKAHLKYIGLLLALILATNLKAQENQDTTKMPIGTNVTDINGNVYHTVTIGTQTWMVEDLKTTRYRNGDSIGTTNPATLDISSESKPKYQWAYDGDESNVATYGRLYTWYAATDKRTIAPIGWHVPTNAEWDTLTNFLGGEIAAQAKLKEAGTKHWNSPNDGTNESGFTALPGGNHWSNKFLGIGVFTHWWTATEYKSDTRFAWRRYLQNDGPAKQYKGSAGKDNGWPVRCIKD
jgi:uncharacterized protein (TIGR02145 family)